MLKLNNNNVLCPIVSAWAIQIQHTWNQWWIVSVKGIKWERMDYYYYNCWFQTSSWPCMIKIWIWMWHDYMEFDMSKSTEHGQGWSIWEWGPLYTETDLPRCTWQLVRCSVFSIKKMKNEVRQYCIHCKPLYSIFV